MSNTFPTAFENRVIADKFLGEDLLTALNTLPPISIRLNPFKTKTELEFSANVKWCENGYYLNERPVFTLDPLFHAGCYYPQEAGSMFLDTVLKKLNLPDNPFILDLCAAPGGKSTLIASFLNDKGLLVSNEVINSRSKILKENMIKWGVTNSIVTNNDPEHFSKLPDFFDVIAVDAPCSGEGMFRKDPNARNEWSEDNVNLCSARQKRIVMDVWDSLKEGGFLIYSTCTFNEEENENNVTWICKETEGQIVNFDCEFGTTGRNGIGNYFIPGKTETEGFYIAVIQKLKPTSSSGKWTKKNDFKTIKDKLDLENFADLTNVEIFNWNEKILAFPSELVAEFMYVHANLHIVKMGTQLGEIARKGIIPELDLAFNPFLRKTDNLTSEVNKDQALQYLHGDTFSLQTANGFRILTYQNEPLGWIKNIGNRFNNLYCKEWRIRMNVR